jgi:hypothetical protein
VRLSALELEDAVLGSGVEDGSRRIPCQSHDEGLADVGSQRSSAPGIGTAKDARADLDGLRGCGSTTIA